MITTCPSCATRYDLPAQNLAPEGSLLRCAACGHSWIEGRAIEVINASPMHQLVTAVEHAPEPDVEIRRLVEARREAEEGFALKRAARRKRTLSWAAYAAAACFPLFAVALMPEEVVRLLPGAVSAYAATGQAVNVYGLEVRRVEMQHLNDNGSVVLAVKGEIANVSASDRKIPWMWFGLHDAAGKDVYHWTLDTGARPLRAGEVTNFVTRIAAPPPAAQKIEIRFARAAEIGSNTAP